MISEKDLNYLYNYESCSIGRLIKHMHRGFDEWATEKLKENSFGDFKMTYMHIVMNVGPEGITNNELSKKATISKQAMSRLVHELTKKKYIKTTKHDKDGRSVMLELTGKGKKLVIETRKSVEQLMEMQRKAIGVKRYNEALGVMQDIIQYHDNLKKQKTKDKAR